MRHFASRRFWESYDRLPQNMRSLANKNYSLLKENPRHPSVQFKKVGPFWSVRVGLNYRALVVEAPDGLVWFWVGSHAEYIDKIKSEGS